MRARLTHSFSYRYSDPVLLGPHRFCLRPRPHGFQRLLDYSLTISPDPSQLYDLLAAGGDNFLVKRRNVRNLKFHPQIWSVRFDEVWKA